jgi:hypothetical protein
MGWPHGSDIQAATPADLFDFLDVKGRWTRSIGRRHSRSLKHPICIGRIAEKALYSFETASKRSFDDAV